MPRYLRKRLVGLVIAGGILGFFLRHSLANVFHRDPPAQLTAPDWRAAKGPLLRTYDIRDLLVFHRDPFWDSPNFSLTDLTVASNASNEHRHAPTEAIIAELIRLIESNIDPASWQSNGGDVGSIRVLEGTLIVKQSEQNQAAVGPFLAIIRLNRAILSAE